MKRVLYPFTANTLYIDDYTHYMAEEGGEGSLARSLQLGVSKVWARMRLLTRATPKGLTFLLPNVPFVPDSIHPNSP
jgi:hypothetical protein